MSNHTNKKAATSKGAEPEDPTKYPLAVYANAKTKDMTNCSSPDQSSREWRFGTGGQDINVITNYVHVSKLPGHVYEYTISYGGVKKKGKTESASNGMAKISLNDIQAGKDKAGKDKAGKDKTGKDKTGDDEAGKDKAGGDEPRQVKTRREKARIFDALSTLQPLSTSPSWATDYTKLWTLSEIQTSDLPLSNLTYKMPNGRPETLLSIDFTLDKDMDLSGCVRSLVGDKQPGQKHHPSEIITALNMIISRHICKQSNQIFSAGANKFFLRSMPTRVGPFHAHRGYFTSIRPGLDQPLLNINTVTSSFYRPQKVSEFMMSNEISQYGSHIALLKNKTVKIGYQIKHENAQDSSRSNTADHFDPNDDANRSRTICDLGRPCNEQRIQVGNKRITVEQHFRVKYGRPLIHGELPAVNIGLGPSADIKKKRQEEGPNISPMQETLNDRANWVPPELLDLEPFQLFGRPLKGTHPTDMINCAVRLPAVTQRLIRTEGLPLMNIWHDAATLGSIDLVADHSLIEIPARLLPVPVIYYANKEGMRSNLHNPKQASWDIRDEDKLVNISVPKPIIALVDLRSSANKDKAKNFSGSEIAEKLEDHVRKHGFSVSKIHIHDCSFALGSQKDEAQFRATLRDLHDTQADIALILLPSDNTEVYSALKLQCDREFGIRTICITPKKVSKIFKPKGPDPQLNRSTFDCLTLKLNIRLGGQNHGLRAGKNLSDGTVPKPPARSTPSAVTSAQSRGSQGDADGFQQVPKKKGGKGKAQNQGWQSQPSGQKTIQKMDPNASVFSTIVNNTIVFGADVIHPSGGSIPGCPSIAAVVANNDGDVSIFPGEVRLQPSRMEVVQNMQSMVSRHLEAWASIMEYLPERILFYRDGVSESQYGVVKQQEISAIKAAYNDLKAKYNTKYDVKVTYIVCGKRHHTRFFPKSEDDTYDGERNGGSSKAPRYNKKGEEIKLNGNVKPGLIVEKVITRPSANENDRIFDFFLQSHGALKGTARACHYVVLENGEKSDAFTVDEIHHYTHALCYNYATATKGISQASPAYYADKLCTRGSQFLYKYFGGKIADKDIPQKGQRRDEIDFPEDDEKFREKMVEWVAQRDEWRPVGNGLNPWHPNMNIGMFYL